LLLFVKYPARVLVGWGREGFFGTFYI
jgi:hypothetical protein